MVSTGCFQAIKELFRFLLHDYVLLTHEIVLPLFLYAAMQHYFVQVRFIFHIVV